MKNKIIKGVLSLGNNIKNARLRKKVTINEIAKLTGFTSSYISQVERNIITPSLKSLIRIGEAVGVPIISLFGSSVNEREPVTRKGRRRHIHLPNSHIEYELLSPSFNTNLEFLLLTIKPHQPVDEEYVSHHGEEAIYIISGTMKVEFENASYSLSPGDSIQFYSTNLHRLMNEGGEEVIAVVVESPPSF
jgi:transcriptional regulator with XRE-family HTH domain